jgi:hypothetical protein
VPTARRIVASKCEADDRHHPVDLSGEARERIRSCAGDRLDGIAEGFSQRVDQNDCRRVFDGIATG